MTTQARQPKVNALGLSKKDYDGAPTTLCLGCGHNSISQQIIQVAYEMEIKAHEIIKLSGIGCSSKSPTYFLGRSHGFNSLHGRMPSVGTGALTANHTLSAIGVSGDGDSGSIGMGQFKHVVRRNVRMVYIIENNGVYGLTKGQFSATAETGLELKYAGNNPFPEVNLCMEALVTGAGFVARSFAGDAQQVRELLKAALHYRGTAVLDIISPCVTFNNADDSRKSYGWSKDNEIPLHEVGFVPIEDEITIGDYEPGEMKVVSMHDGSQIQLRKLEEDYNPSSRVTAINRLMEAEAKDEFITGLIYHDPDRENLAEVSNLPETPLAHLGDEVLRPPKEALDKLMQSMM